MKTIGVADTTFARIDMGKIALDALEKNAQEKISIVRLVVPGIKDLPVAAKKLLDEQNCDIVIACGMVGRAKIDETCAHEASLGIIWAQLLTNKHILGVFVHENEVKDDAQLKEVAFDRVSKHCINALNLVFSPNILLKNAGKAKRQGFADEKFIEV